jgi:putative SbcD/Mre11-related phosphoesterase
MTMIVHGDWILTAQRAAVHVPTATAVIADLHLGYDGARRRGGEAVPSFPLDDTLAVLHALVTQQGIRRLVIAGDLLEDGHCPQAVAELLDWLKAADVELLGVVPGNHDRGFELGSSSVPLVPAGIDVGGWRILHGDGRLPRGRVVHGHLHPCLRWQGRKAAPCFLVGPSRLILPAFSNDAAGVNVRTDRRWRSFRCFAPAGRGVLDFGPLGALANESRRR